MNKIVVIGSSNIDLIMKMERLPEKGETVTDAEFHQVFGGKGANQAVAAARAGGDVAFISCLGEDGYTSQMIENFKTAGIDTRFILMEKGVPSGCALIMVGEKGMNYISVAPAANNKLTPEKAEAMLSLIAEAAMIVLQFEIPEPTIKKIIEMASQRGIPVLWNVAPVKNFDHSLILKIKYLVLNKVEASFLSKTDVNSIDDAKNAAVKLLNSGVENVIITLGEEGVLAVNQSSRVFFPAFKVTPVDTTAAGDTFCGNLAVALAEGHSVHNALQFACAASAISVTRLGAQPSAPFRKETVDFLDTHREVTIQQV